MSISYVMKSYVTKYSQGLHSGNDVTLALAKALLRRLEIGKLVDV